MSIPAFVSPIDRIPPNNLEAEMALLGSVLVDKEMMAAVSEIVRSNDFYASLHETIYLALYALYESGKPLDKVALAEELRSRGMLDKVGGIAYLSSLMDTVATAASAEYYAKIVREKASLRGLIHAGTQITKLGYEAEEDVPAASIRDSIMAMKAVAGMENPLLEARVVRTGTRLAFRHGGEMVDPIRRQLLFDFERVENGERRSAAAELAPMRPPAHGLNEKFMAAVQAEEAGNKQRAITLYEQLLALDPRYAAACINLGTVYFHLRQYGRAEEFYRRATEIDPNYVLAYFDLGNVLDELVRFDESIAAYKRAVALSPRYADAHYNLALAYERRGEERNALRHWQAYVRLDNRGPWADHARGQIRKLLDREKLQVAYRTAKFIAPRKGMAALALV